MYLFISNLVVSFVILGIFSSFLIFTVPYVSVRLSDLIKFDINELLLA